MTQDELDRIEALLPNATHATAEGGDMWPVILEVPALVAEVKRLRGLVEAAYREGLIDDVGHEFYIQLPDEMWSKSDARRALDGTP